VKFGFILLAAFQVWMIVDALRRRAEFYWLVILILFGPLSSVVYFFAVKIHDYDLSRFRLTAKKPALAELKHRAEETPSLVNKLALADAFEAADQFADAIAPYEDVLRLDKDNKDALHGVGRAWLGLGKPDQAIVHFERLMELDSGFHDYGAALDYAEALWQNGQRDDTIELLTGLVGASSRMNHRLALAHYMALAGREAPARDQLELALRDYEHAPAFIKRRDQKWKKRAEEMLATLG
jgi:hypothetical protein